MFSTYVRHTLIISYVHSNVIRLEEKRIKH